MRFQILGALQVSGETGQPLALEPRHNRVLAVLLLTAGQAVGRDQLIDAVWDEDPPSTAGRQLQNLISALRQRIPEPVLTAEPTGYRIRLTAGQLDAAQFQSHVDDALGLAAQGQTQEAVAQFRAALSLWQGPALAGMHGRAIEAGAARLNEQRLSTLEECLELEIQLGRHQQIVGELIELVSANPVRERFVGQLMLALHGSGRQSEALQVYERLRAHLADELGLDPGNQLQLIHGKILRNDTGPTTTPVATPALPSLVVPRQLPAPVRHFVGRMEELSELEDLLPSVGARVVVIAALDGMGGIGKTALAVRWAHHIADQFPDGQLFVNLRGFDPAGPPMATAEAVRGFLDALGVHKDSIPAGLDAQINLYRSLVSGRKILVVLDNARDIEQVRPLLPGSGTCLVVVTSRNQLTGLIVAEGARGLTLNLLTPDEARHLLAARLGEQRLTLEPQAVAELIQHCAHLPLALAIIAARAAAQPTFPLATFAAELADIRRRLDAVDGGDQYTQVRAVFSWSYQRLPAVAARLFRLLGLHVGPDITLPAAASLGGVPLGQTRQLLNDLTRARLLSEHVPGRYAFHDLLSAYALEEAHAQDSVEEQQVISGRMFDHYLHTACMGDKLLYPRRDPIQLTPPLPGVVPEQPADIEAALAWFNAEHRVLLACIERAYESAMDSYCVRLVWAVASYLERRGHWHDWSNTQQAGLDAARRGGDLWWQGTALRGLSRAAVVLNEAEAATEHLTEALALFQQLKDPVHEGHTRINLAQALELDGLYGECRDHAAIALELYRAAGHKLGQANALNFVGWMCAHLGDNQGGIEYCRQALALHREIGHQLGQANTLHSIGFAYQELGSAADAAAYYDQAAALYRHIGDQYHLTKALSDLGDCQYAIGAHTAARASWKHALSVCPGQFSTASDTLRSKLETLRGPGS